MDPTVQGPRRVSDVALAHHHLDYLASSAVTTVSDPPRSRLAGSTQWPSGACVSRSTWPRGADSDRSCRADAHPPGFPAGADTKARATPGGRSIHLRQGDGRRRTTVSGTGVGRRRSAPQRCLQMRHQCAAVVVEADIVAALVVSTIAAVLGWRANPDRQQDGGLDALRVGTSQRDRPAFLARQSSASTSRVEGV